MRKSVYITSIIISVFIASVILVSCGGGGGGSGSTAVERTAFYTSTSGTGDMSSWAEVSGSGLTGLEAADAICNTRATTAGLSGTYVAWLSDAADDAYCRVHGLTGKRSASCGQIKLPDTAGPWFRTDGTPFVDSIYLLANSGLMYSPMRYNELGSSFDLYLSYWSATNTDGTLYGDNCSDWTDSTISGPLVALGNTFATDFRATRGVSSTLCSQSNRLLCMELGADNVSANPQATGKKIFSTSIFGDADLGGWAGAGGNTGIDAGDAICQTLAAAASLPDANLFEAWLSDSTTNAIDRIASDGPWVRVDGMMVASSKSSLVNSWLLTSISLDEQGVYSENGIWTSTLSNGNYAGAACSDWTSSSLSTVGHYGISTYADGSQWTSRSTSGCGQLRALYCLEDNGGSSPYATGFETGDPAFELAVGGGTFSNTPPAGTTARTGSRVITNSVDLASDLTTSYTGTRLQSVDCLPLINNTDLLTASGYGMADVGNDGNNITGRIRMNWYTDAACTTSHATPYYGGTGVVFPEGAYAMVTFSAVPPSGATHYKVALEVKDDNSGFNTDDDWAADDLTSSQ